MGQAWHPKADLRVKLVASAIVRNEADRYLRPWLSHLLEFCDRVVLLDDSSDDDTFEICAAWSSRAYVYQPWPGRPMFDDHEGRARQALLDLTLEVLPEPATHVLSIDADEFVTDGAVLRRLVENDWRAPAWAMPMREVWELDGDCLCQRDDGLWRPHKVTSVWRVDNDRFYEIEDKALACGRTPTSVRQIRPMFLNEPSLLHFGWTNPDTRRARYDRYMQIDGGSFHNRAHLESIMAPEDQVQLTGLRWPEGLKAYRSAITRVACKTAARDVS